MNPLDELLASLNHRLPDVLPASLSEEDEQYWAQIEDEFNARPEDDDI